MKRKKAEEGPTEDGGAVESHEGGTASKPGLMQNKPAAWGLQSKQGGGE